MELTADARAELERLAVRHGPARRLSTVIDDSFDDPIRKKDRFGEVCMAVRRPNGTLLVAIKTFYPRGAYRLPTGGIHHGEAIGDALAREAREETGLDVEVRRFLAHIAYTAAEGAPPLFHTFAFLLDEVGGALHAMDDEEQIEDWREITPPQLGDVARFLEDLKSEGTRGIGGSWRAWGRFRAIVHRVVHDALTG